MSDNENSTAKGSPEDERLRRKETASAGVGEHGADESTGAAKNAPEGEGSGSPFGGEGADDEQKAKEDQELYSVEEDTLLELKKMAEERDLFREELLRVRADLDNYQKRVRRDRPKWEDQAVRRFLGEILPVVDNFELALVSAAAGNSDTDGLREGIQLIYQMMRKVLEDNGVEEIKSLGEMFDPAVHDAVAEEEVSDGETGRIIEVQQRGYSYKGVVVRPSRVKVAKNVEAGNS